MEAAKVLGKSSKLETSLCALDVDALGSITWYLFRHGMDNLWLTGDRRLQAKLRKMKSVTISWKNSKFCLWSKCLPFLKSFTGFYSLTLCTEFEYHRSRLSFNASMLPPFLTHLELRFHGSLVLLDDLRLPRLVPKLRTLILEEKRLNYEDIPTIRFDNLPSTILHLHIFSSGIYDLKTLAKLPRDLQTFDVAGFRPDTVQDGAPIVFGTSGVPSSLTHLSTSASAKSIIDISNIAAQLKHLCIQTGNVYYKSNPIFSSKHTSANNRLPSSGSNSSINDISLSIRDFLPQLQTLQLPSSIELSWSLFETFPHSIESIYCNFEVLSDEVIQHLSEINDKYLKDLSQQPTSREPSEASTSAIVKKGDGNERHAALRAVPAAPAMLRRFSFSPDHLHFIDRLLPLFSNLTTLTALEAHPAAIHAHCPSQVQTLNCDILSTDFRELPRSLQHLSIKKLSDVLQKSLDDLRPAETSAIARSLSPQVPPLLSLALIQPLSTSLIDILPHSLTSLYVTIDHTAVLNALGRKSNIEHGMPYLTALSITASSITADSRKVPTLQLSTPDLPASLHTLRLRGFCGFPDPSSSSALRYHPNLKLLDVFGEVSPAVMFSMMAPQLKELKVSLDAPIDLNIPENIKSLQNDFPISLKSLILSRGFIPVKRSLLTASMINLLAASHKERFGIALALPVKYWTSSMVYMLSESFVFSCLPTSLVELSMPVSAFNKLGEFENSLHSPPLNDLLAYRINQPWNWICRFVMTRLPLLGLFMTTDYSSQVPTLFQSVNQYCINKRSESLPPNISVLNLQQADLRVHYRRFATNLAIGHEPRPVKRYWGSKEDFAYRIGFHCVNFASWAHIYYMCSLTYQSHPIAWTYHLINMIGSALFLPRLMNGYRKAPSVRYTLAPPPWKTAIYAASIWLVSFTSAIAFGYLPPQWDINRPLAILCTAIGEVTIQSFVKDLF